MNILMLRHSAGFEHTYLPDAEAVLKQIEKKGWQVRTTHHSQRVSAETLADTDLLIFATTGTRKNKNKHCLTLLKEGNPSSVFTMRQTLL